MTVRPGPRATRTAAPTVSAWRVGHCPGGGLPGHTGEFLGYETMAGATLDGRQATAMVNLGPGGSDGQSDGLEAVIGRCAHTPSSSPGSRGV